ncbi:NAD-dependent epimerase/dehydratase family protein [Ornithinimicrobium flavum]|uniref:NAD-dependent epimerase/dehydratase family protein n=1 Tax=Ornithinimicrobium flavum TaxID=1288636 RepID=UPI003084271D
MSTIVIAGATGFLGQHLQRSLTRDGFTVRTIGRTGGDARWARTCGPSSRAASRWSTWPAAR